MDPELCGERLQRLALMQERVSGPPNTNCLLEGLGPFQSEVEGVSEARRREKESAIDALGSTTRGERCAELREQ
jgi:hypothetical protein